MSEFFSPLAPLLNMLLSRILQETDKAFVELSQNGKKKYLDKRARGEKNSKNHEYYSSTGSLRRISIAHKPLI